MRTRGPKSCDCINSQMWVAILIKFLFHAEKSTQKSKAKTKEMHEYTKDEKTGKTVFAMIRASLLEC